MIILWTIGYAKAFKIVICMSCKTQDGRTERLINSEKREIDNLEFSPLNIVIANSIGKMIAEN